MLVRELRPADFEDIVEYYYRFYDELTENPSLGLVLSPKKPTMSEELRWFADLYQKASAGIAVVTVAEIDSHVVGMCEVTRLGRPGSEVSHRGELGIAISKEHRGKGVGTALLRETIRKCEGLFEVIELTVFENNSAAKSLYQKLGFTVYATRPKAVKRNGKYFDDTLMRLQLGN